MYLVGNSVDAQEAAASVETRVRTVGRETNADSFKGSEQQMEAEAGSLIPSPGAGQWLLENRDSHSSSGRQSRSRSRSISTATRSRSSSVSSRSSYSSGRHGNQRNYRRRAHYRSSSSSCSSRSRSRSRSQSRPRPRCHRAPSCSRCCRGRRRSPPRRYRARSRSYSPSYSPVRRNRHHRRSPHRSRSRSRSISRARGRRVHGFVGRSRFRIITSPSKRPRSRSRSGVRSTNSASVQLSLEEKRQLLLIAKENAAKTLGVEDVALPSSVNTVLGVSEEPAIGERVRPGGSALGSLKENYGQADAEQEVPSLKMSSKSKITFSINNSVAKPATGRSGGSPEKSPPVRSYSQTTAQKPYGHWVPIKARSFPLSTSTRSPTKSR